MVACNTTEINLNGNVYFEKRKHKNWSKECKTSGSSYGTY